MNQLATDIIVAVAAFFKGQQSNTVDRLIERFVNEAGCRIVGDNCALIGFQGLRRHDCLQRCFELRDALASTGLKADVRVAFLLIDVHFKVWYALFNNGN